MNVNFNNKYTNNFKAIKVATAQNTIGKKVTNIDLYKIEKSDENFLLNLKKVIDYKKYFPKLNTLGIQKWKHILDFCVNSALDSDFITYVGINDGKPCGIINYTEDSNSKNGIFLNGICSIPTEIGKKVRFGGQTLFLQLFKDALEQNAKYICLCAINNGPFNVVDKYEKLGFIKNPTSYPYTEMVCNKYKIQEKAEELSERINYESVEPEKIDLNCFLESTD